MKKLLVTILLISGQMAFAKIRCAAFDEKITIDPKGKSVEIIKDGKPHVLRILSQNHHAYKIFGDSTYEVQGGYVLGLKAMSPKSKKKRLTVFKNGEPLSSVSDCSGH